MSQTIVNVQDNREIPVVLGVITRKGISNNLEVLITEFTEEIAHSWGITYATPGGKIKKNETPEEALKRELEYQLGVEIVVQSFIDEIRTTTANGIEHIYYYHVTLSHSDDFMKNNPEPKKYKRQMWIPLIEIDTYNTHSSPKVREELMRLDSLS